MKKNLLYLTLIFLMSCGGPAVLRDVKVNDLSIKETVVECQSGRRHVLYLSGVINEDSTAILRRMLRQASTCVNEYGQKISTMVVLNSRGGYLSDGFKIGKLFTEYQIHTHIGYRNTCASSCSTAFLGGKYRTMEKTSTLMVHSPYVYRSRNTIECQSRIRADNLRKYYIARIGNEDGELLFNRTMKYCSNKKGWRLNGDAARLFGILSR